MYVIHWTNTDNGHVLTATRNSVTEMATLVLSLDRAGKYNIRVERH